MDIQLLFKQLGFSEKETRLYLTLLSYGPSSVRSLARESGVNRGTVYDTLKSLREKGLVSYYHRDKKQYFVGEDPEKIKDFISLEQRSLNKIKKQIQKAVPELRSLYVKGGTKPVARYYEGSKGIAQILRDVLKTAEFFEIDNGEQKSYRTYSSLNIREYLYKDFPDFTKQRIKAGVNVRVIAIGEGGEGAELSERKWLRGKKDVPQNIFTPVRRGSSPTYIIIYGHKTAFISLAGSENAPQKKMTNQNIKLVGVIIEDEGIAKTQKIIFDYIWKQL